MSTMSIGGDKLQTVRENLFMHSPHTQMQPRFGVSLSLKNRYPTLGNILHSFDPLGTYYIGGWRILLESVQHGIQLVQHMLSCHNLWCQFWSNHRQSVPVGFH